MERYKDIGERDPNEEDDTLDIEFSSNDIDLTSALRLIERLEALDELSELDRAVAKETIQELEEVRKNFLKQKTEIPEALTYALGELRELLLGATRSVKEEYARKESGPDTLQSLLAESGKLELELIEQQASGRLKKNAEILKKKIDELLPRLEKMTLHQDEDTRAVIESQRTILRKFLRIIEAELS